MGVVLGTEQKRSEALEFWIGVFENAYIELDEVVMVESMLPGRDKSVKFYGTVQYVSRHFEGIGYDSDINRVAEGLLPAQPSYAAKVSITRVSPEIYVPPAPGQQVFRARDNELLHGLYIDKMERRIPAGFLRSGDIYYLDYDFISGGNGAHVSISGISGIATKTTYSVFLLHSILHSGVLGAEAAGTRCLVFNVKAEDLMFIDKANNKLSAEEHTKYESMGLPAEPFGSVSLYSPAKVGAATPVPSTERRQEGVLPYFWTLRQIAKERLFAFLFTEGEDQANLFQVIRLVENRLYELANDGASADKPLSLDDGTQIEDLFSLHDIIQANPVYWVQNFGAQQNQINAFLRRLYQAAFQTRGLIRSAPVGWNLERSIIDWNARQLTVVDIHNLSAGAKMFVVASILKRMFREKEQRGTAHPLVICCIDELNKYAPRDGFSPIKDVIVDISERGRSLGIILIGAQQTASEVESRVFGNSAIKVVGRMDSAESEHREYGFLGPVFKQRARLISPGTMILSQPSVPVPVLIRFPFPCWATRPEEHVPLDGADPFAGFDQGTKKAKKAPR